MSIKKLKKQQQAVNRYIRAVNKALRGDKFASRFSIKQVGRDIRIERNWPCGKPASIKLYDRNTDFDNSFVGYTRYHIEIYDHECPERNVVMSYCFSNLFGFHSGWSYNFDNCMTKNKTHWESCYGMDPRGNLMNTLNEFIQQSDFDEKWEDPEYRKTHWYSSPKLLRMFGTREEWETKHERR